MGEEGIDDDNEIDVENARPDDRLALRIRRKSARATFPLLDMSYGSVIVSDTYSELSLVLPTSIGNAILNPRYQSQSDHFILELVGTTTRTLADNTLIVSIAFIAYGQGVGALSFANASLNTNFNK